MKVLHVCYRFYPDRGGSETYTSNLIRELSCTNVDSSVVCLAEGARRTSWEQVSVWGVPYGDVERGLAETIKGSGADLIHFHFRPNIALDLINPRSTPTIFTLHHASTVCLRGTLIQNGERLCTGNISREICLPCSARNLGSPALLAD